MIFTCFGHPPPYPTKKFLHAWSEHRHSSQHPIDTGNRVCGVRSLQQFSTRSPVTSILIYIVYSKSVTILIALYIDKRAVAERLALSLSTRETRVRIPVFPDFFFTGIWSGASLTGLFWYPDGYNMTSSDFQVALMVEICTAEGRAE